MIHILRDGSRILWASRGAVIHSAWREKEMLSATYDAWDVS